MKGSYHEILAEADGIYHICTDPEQTVEISVQGGNWDDVPMYDAGRVAYSFLHLMRGDRLRCRVALKCDLVPKDDTDVTVLDALMDDLEICNPTVSRETLQKAMEFARELVVSSYTLLSPLPIGVGVGGFPMLNEAGKSVSELDHSDLED